MMEVCAEMFEIQIENNSINFLCSWRRGKWEADMPSLRESFYSTATIEQTHEVSFRPEEISLLLLW